MKLKILIAIFVMALTTQCSLIEIEHEEDLIVQIKGKWKLTSITFDGRQNITPCDKTTYSEFTLDPYDDKDFNFDYSGDYIGTAYFYTEALESCSPEIFVGSWDWDDEEVTLTLNITGTSTGTVYTNEFDMAYGYLEGSDSIVDTIYLTFKNEDEDFERVYLYEREE
ncbi:hypothetical protein Q2T41_00450 [Maribacter confluentis]|uniref:Lipocalin-like domain-containing protein n=1 Tax=Maribacter confluentis TaxID=1656093 RepID=A0ABT8RJ99_9FLAO|nr:hypothetical protein [Maribacter confluentis]MDO1511130.1 hypothetical protein [Maribacter confluentis]